MWRKHKTKDEQKREKKPTVLNKMPQTWNYTQTIRELIK